MRWAALGVLTALLAGCVGAEEAAETDVIDARVYDLTFDARLQPGTGDVLATVTLTQPEFLLRELSFAESPRLRDIEADGELHRQGERWVWKPTASGGSLSYRFVVDQRRGDAFDARMTDNWTIFRLGDLFPPARVRTLKGAQSRSRLKVTSTAPEWSVETRYGSVGSDSVTVGGDRNFNRPTGWLIAGDLGVRRDRIGDLRVAVAAPVGSGFHRMDVLTFLNFALPSLTDVFPPDEERLLIVGAPASMWRGGLSGPDSFFLQTERPLVSENGTGTLLHELVHVLTGWIAGDADDWIVEGIAEYYAIEALYRAGGLSERRRQRVYEALERWVAASDGRLADPSKGADTAAAVLLLRDLDERLGGRIDAVMAELSGPEVTRAELFDATGRIGRVTDRQWLETQVAERSKADAR